VKTLERIELGLTPQGLAVIHHMAGHPNEAGEYERHEYLLKVGAFTVGSFPTLEAARAAVGGLIK